MEVRDVQYVHLKIIKNIFFFIDEKKNFYREPANVFYNSVQFLLHEYISDQLCLYVRHDKH